jgi:glycosyltransferase involved in cell wall biosynthesis
MKILVISQYYYPEPGATSNRLQSFVEALQRRGHEVDVICEFPNHPTGDLAPGDRRRLFRVERHDSGRIIRTFVLAFRRKNNFNRMLFYLSFAISSFLAALFLKKHDVVFASSPPIFYTFAAMMAARLKGSKFVLDIRDIWPDGALEVEAVTSGRLLKWGGYLEKKIYKNAALIFAVSKGVKNTIESRGGTGKTHIVYNGSQEDILNWRGDIESFRKSRGWEDKFIVCYAGLMGLSQNLVEMIPEIREFNNPDINFVFIGDGPGKSLLEKKADSENLNNVKFIDLMPRAEVIPYIYSSDAMMVILRETVFFKSAIPSKLFDYMAAGKPVITNVDGELREILTENKAGLFFSLKEGGSFATAVRTLKENPELSREMGKNGKKAVREDFLRSRLAAEMIKRIEVLVDQR